MSETTSQLSSQFKRGIAKLKKDVKLESAGRIEEVGDGIAIVSGLSDVMYNELLKFPQKTIGVALNLNPDTTGVVILGKSRHLKQGDIVRGTGRLLNVPVGENFTGRIIDPLGRPLDGQSKPEAKEFYPSERIAPGVITREPVNTPLQTGIKAIDSIIPIGRGQRELIIGDRSTGKSSVAITTIINQKDTNVVSIYVIIGQKASFVSRLASIFDHFGVLDKTIIVAATASSSPALQYLAPYAGCALGEYFAYNGKDALIVYDDLSKHAWAYRELSLLLRRPSGREAYPGDIFYLHARLLERAVKLNKKNGGGSLTALPIIETQAGDISAYIPTNVISITDGQIYLEPDLFNAGVRPAINVGTSVSRVGSSAQIKAMKQVAGKLRLEIAQYRELAAFAQFSSDLDPQTQSQLERGVRITEILKQGWDEPTPVENQVVIIWAATNGYLDNIKQEDIKNWETKFLDFLEISHPDILPTIKKEKIISDKLEKQLQQTVDTFNSINISMMVEKQEEE